MYKFKYFIIAILNVLIFALFINNGLADVEIKLDTTTIKANTELPKIIYIIPWKQTKQSKHTAQDLIIHSLYDGDVFSPILPDET